MKPIYYFLFAVAITGLSVIAIRYPHGKHSNPALAGIRRLPKFDLLYLDSATVLPSADIPKGIPLIFFDFDPNCEHCQQTTREILKKSRQFQGCQLYFLTDVSTSEVNTFRDYYRLDTVPNIFIGFDKAYSFFNAFLPSSIPYMAIYNRNGELTRIFNGSPNVDTLVQLIF